MHEPRKVLIAGGGVAALEAVLALRALAGDRVTIELLAPGSDFIHRPSSVLAPFSGEDPPRVPFDLTGVVHHRGALEAVDATRHQCSPPTAARSATTACSSPPERTPRRRSRAPRCSAAR
jgi:sulfide:quinone oxidoreductase